MTVGWFRLPPERAAVLTTAVDAMVLRRPDQNRIYVSADVSATTSRWPSLCNSGPMRSWRSSDRAEPRRQTEVVVHLRLATE